MLARKVFVASAVLSTGRLAVRFLDLIAALLIARFLTPADFGMVSLAIALLMTLRAVTELPVSEALIRSEDLTRADIDTAFTLSLLRGLTVAGLLAAAAWPMARIYDDPRLADLTMALAIAPLAMAVRSPQLVKFSRAVNYVPATVLDIGTRLAGFAASVALVLASGSYWALIVGLVVPPIIAAPISYLVAPYRPRLSLASWKAILAFAGWVSLSRLIATANSEIDRFFIGGVLDKAAVGFFAMGRSVATTASWAIGMPLMQAMFPGFARIQSDRSRVQAAYLKGQGLVVATVMPLGFGLGLVAQPLVALALGDQWQPVAQVIAVLAPVGALATMTMPVHAVVLALGRPKPLVVRDFLAMVLGIPAVIVGALWFGLMGAVYARMLGSLVQVLLNLQILKRTLGLSVTTQLGNSWRSAVAVGAMSGVLLAFRPLADGNGTVGQVVELAAATGLGAISYLAVHGLLWLIAGKPFGPERLVLDWAVIAWRRLCAPLLRKAAAQ
jgi:PST family polysaccharide transporter